MKDFIKIPLFFGAFVLVGLAFGFLTFTILSFSRTVEVPAITNKTLLEANESLNKAGLYLKIEGEDFDSSVQAGRILRQDIPAGNKVKEKRSIKVVVSKGPRIFSVPLLVDQTLGAASDILAQKGLRIGKVITVHSDYAEKGKIIAQKPGPEDKLTDTVTVLVSAGPHELTYYCPDFLNRSIDDAKETAGKLGLAVETTGPGGFVRDQKPKAGTPVKAGDTVYFDTKEENAL